MTDFEETVQMPEAKAVTSGRKAWVTPELRSIKAGSAENGLTQANKDGQFTRS